jgi:membrane-associated protease RseP (regulator of RpoE activity)
LIRAALRRVLPYLLFFLTLATTTVVGARMQWNFNRCLPAYATPADMFPFPWIWHNLGLLTLGLPFSLSLIAILLAHEMGHYLACRYYRIECTYPLFLPAPTLVGTLGAFIRIRSPFLDRRALFDVGIAGPLAGMALALPVLAWGVATSHILPAAAAGAHSNAEWISFAWPPLQQWIAAGLHPGVVAGRIALSPVARAGWIALLVTMLNLIPAAQLDGGHIVYALSPRLHRVTSWAALLLLLWGGWRYWPGWFVFAALIAAMRLRHPWVPETPALGRARLALALLALVIFAVTFMAAPVLALAAGG